MKTTTLPAWKEWKVKCAVMACTPDTRSLLSEWGAPIFRNAAAKVYSNHEMARSTNQELWVEFETRMHTKKAKDGAYGKLWKDHVFRLALSGSRKDPPCVQLEKLLTKQLKWVAIKYAKKEKAIIEDDGGKPVLSLETPVSTGPESPTWREVYPDADNPCDNAALDELKDIALKCAQSWFDSRLTARDKLALGCTYMYRSRNDPDVLNAAGCGKSQFFEKSNPLVLAGDFVKSIASQYIGEDPGTVRILISLATTALFKLCADTLPPEKS